MAAARLGALCVVLGALGALQGALGAPPTKEKDWAPLLRNKGLVDSQMKCLQGSGPCDRIGDHLKRAAAEVLSRNCASCSPEQRSNANRLLTFIRDNYPAEYGQIYNRYRG